MKQKVMVNGTIRTLKSDKSNVNGTIYKKDILRCFADGRVRNIKLSNTVKIVIERSLSAESYIAVGGVQYKDAGAYDAEAGTEVTVFCADQRTSNHDIVFNGKTVSHQQFSPAQYTWNITRPVRIDRFRDQYSYSIEITES